MSETQYIPDPDELEDELEEDASEEEQDELYEHFSVRPTGARASSGSTSS